MTVSGSDSSGNDSQWQCCCKWLSVAMTVSDSVLAIDSQWQWWLVAIKFSGKDSCCPVSGNDSQWQWQSVEMTVSDSVLANDSQWQWWLVAIKFSGNDSCCPVSGNASQWKWQPVAVTVWWELLTLWTRSVWPDGCIIFQSCDISKIKIAYLHKFAKAG